VNETEKAIQRAIEDAQGRPSSRAVASEAFNNTMQQMYIPPSTSDHLRALFGADRTIAALAETIQGWEEKTPEGKHLVVTLQTPDGRVMVVALVKPTGDQSFVAEGMINGIPCMITGHIGTLSLFCSYEEPKGKSRLGFRIEAAPISESQPPPAPAAPERTERNP